MENRWGTRLILILILILMLGKIDVAPLSEVAPGSSSPVELAKPTFADISSASVSFHLSFPFPKTDAEIPRRGSASINH